MGESLNAESIRIDGHGGDEIEAYLARPSEQGRRGGVVVIHHMPGYDRATKEIVRRFAETGLRRDLPQPLLARGAGRGAGRRRGHRPRAPAASPTSDWSATWPGAATYLRALPTRTARSA